MNFIVVLLISALASRGGVEDTRLDAKAKDTKKIQGQGQGQPFRVQGQECLRPRTKDTAASVLKKKKKRSSKKSFSDSLQFIGVARIFDWEGPNHKSHAMTSSKIFKRGIFCGTKISSDGTSDRNRCLLALNQDFAKREGLNSLVGKLMQNISFVNH